MKNNKGAERVLQIVLFSFFYIPLKKNLQVGHYTSSQFTEKIHNFQI